MYLQKIVTFSLALLQTSLCHDDIHTFMSEDQIRQVFHTEADFVQEHEVVKINFPERLLKRQISIGQPLSFRAFGDEINLSLKTRDSILFGRDTPVYYARYSPNSSPNVTFRAHYGMMNTVGAIMEDPRHFASVVVSTRHNDGKRRINGHVGSKRLAIRSVPQSVVHEYLRKRRSIDDIDDSSNYHVVYRTNENDPTNSSSPNDKMMLIDEKISKLTTPSQVPSIVYPEILVVVENSIYREHGCDIYALLEYLLAFWNSVDLKYRKFENPTVRLHISAIVIGMEPEATPYISNNMYTPTNFNVTGALGGGKLFFYGIKDSFPLYSYDVALTLTRHKMEAGIRGAALRGGACEIDDKFKSTSRAGLVTDNGRFDGVHRAAHELGHQFGIVHDGIYNGTFECLVQYGFIMVPFPIFTANSSSFSSCSLNIFRERLEGGHLKCLYNVPRKIGRASSKLLPGKVLSLDEQCKSHFGQYSEVKSCKPDNLEIMDVCVTYYCNSNRSCKKANAVALDGTPCGDENDVLPRICLNQECVVGNNFELNVS